MKFSLAQQRQAIEHLLVLQKRNNAWTDTIQEAAKQGALTLAWLERRSELMKALDRLERERPELVELLNAFPGSEIVDVREAI
jgi:hypothetical protein